MPAALPMEQRIALYCVLVDECWIYTGCLDDEGYPKLNIKIDGKRVWLAHRASWLHFIGPIPGK